MNIVRGSTLSFVPAAHEDPRNPGVLKKILFTEKDFRAGKVQINWAKMEKGRSFRPHYHKNVEEVFIIVCGVVRMMVGDEEVLLGRGDAVIVPNNTEHTMTAEEEVEYIVLGVGQDSGGKTVVGEH